MAPTTPPVDHGDRDQRTADDPVTRDEPRARGDRTLPARVGSRLVRPYPPEKNAEQPNDTASNSTVNGPGRAAAAGCARWLERSRLARVHRGERQVQVRHRPRVRRSEPWVGLPVEILVYQRENPLAKLLELGRVDPQDPVAELARLPPLRRLIS
jgi:hypothetical protein